MVSLIHEIFYFIKKIALIMDLKVFISNIYGILIFLCINVLEINFPSLNLLKMRHVYSPQRWFSLAFLFLFAILTDLSAYSQTFSLTDTVRIMPLGNSITYGRYSIELRPPGMIPGYRQPLWQKLNEAGFHVNFVGSQSTGYNLTPAFDTDHEGWPGWTDAQICRQYLRLVDGNPADISLASYRNKWSDSQSGRCGKYLNEIDRYEQDNSETVTVLPGQDHKPLYLQQYNNTI